MMESVQSATTTSLFLSVTNGTDAQAKLHAQPARPVSRASSTAEVSGPLGTSGASLGDRVSLSQEGSERSRERSATGHAEQSSPFRADHEPPAQASSLDAEEVRMVEQLEQRDREVRAHEQAHLASAGAYAAGGASYTYQQGPDGKRYAVGGEVPIDLSKEPTPEATIQKMQIVRKAALAPASPSAADRRIAAAATSKEALARQEIQQQEQAEDLPGTTIEMTAEHVQPAGNTVNTEGTDANSSSRFSMVV